MSEENKKEPYQKADLVIKAVLSISALITAVAKMIEVLK